MGLEIVSLLKSIKDWKHRKRGLLCIIVCCIERKGLERRKKCHDELCRFFVEKMREIDFFSLCVKASSNGKLVYCEIL